MFLLDDLAAGILAASLVQFREVTQAELDLDQALCLATNIYHESRGEISLGKAAVASVTKNRVNSTRFPDTYCEVVTQARRGSYRQILKGKCAFSWYCDGKPDDVVIENFIDENSWWESVNEALVVMSGIEYDFTYGADHYLVTTINTCWSQLYDETVVIGNHRFLKSNWSVCYE